MSYEPTVSAEYAARLRTWHEAAYAAARAEAAGGPQTFDRFGRTIVVPPDVQPITRFSRLLGQAVLDEVRPGDRVLDMGTGSGVNAILAAAVSRDVVAVDVNPSAVAAARANAVRNDVVVDVRGSDVFAAVDGTFDLIVFDPPFRWFTPRDRLEMATADPGYRALTAFFGGVRCFLAPGGRLLLFFGTSGDLGYLRRLVAEAGFVTEIVTRDSFLRDGWRVEYYVHRLTVSD
jgi:release factor glutamine methyltransferase